MAEPTRPKFCAEPQMKICITVVTSEGKMLKDLFTIKR